MAPLTLIGNMVRGCGGLWQYLIARSHNRTQLELEREWTRAGQHVLACIPPGTQFIEYSAGRCRAITVPAHQPTVAETTANSSGLPEPSGP